jgi:hypothetical protein
MASPEELQLAVTAVSLNTQTAEQAALVNQAYMSNNLPVLSPVAVSPATQDYGQLSQYQREQVYKGGTQNNLILTWNTQGLTDPANQQGKAVYLTPTEYQQQYGATDAQREQVRYNIFNNPAAVNPSSVPEDMKGIYGAQLQQSVHEYYMKNPSPEFLALTGQYEANRYGSVGSGTRYSYNYGSSKNPFDPNSAAGIAWDVNRLGGTVGKTLGGTAYSEGYNAVVTDAPDRSTIPTRLVGSGMVAGMPQGSQFVDDVDIYMAVGGYQGVKVADSKLAIDYQTGEFGVYQKMGTHNVYGLVGGGGWNSLQSGMFSFGESLWDKEHTYAQSDIGKMTPVSKSYMETHSKAGAEAYGGFSRELNGNLLEPNDAISRYGNWNNLANYVQPIASTKGSIPGAKIPWTMSPGEPAAQYMDETGLTGSTFDVSMPETSDRLVGGKTVAGFGTVSDRELPAPFMSTSSPEERSGAPGFSKYDQAILGGYSGGLIGYALWGEKSPDVIKGAIGSVIDFFPAMVGWTPVADRMRVTDPGQADYIAGMGARSSELKGLSEQGAAKYGVDSQGRILIDSTNPEAVAFQTKYETARTGYEDYMKSGVEKGYTKYQGGSLIVNPDLTYDYGEYSKWGAGAGSVIREKLGFSKEQLDTYGMQVESRQGLQYIPEKIVYGTGYTLSTRPEKILTAYGAGIVTMGAGEVYGTIMQTPRIAAATSAFGTAHPTAAAIGAGIMHYGVPAVMIGATYYGASEGLTATPERTTVNIGKVLPELGGFVYGGATGYAALRAADAGYVGFRTTERPLTGKEALEGKPLGIVDLTADQSWRYSIPQTTPAAEPYIIVGKTRAPVSEIKTTPDLGKINLIPSEEINPLTRVMTSEKNINPFEQARARGVAGPGEYERATSAKFSIDKLAEDMGLYSQKPSPQTATFWERRQLETWGDPAKVPGIEYKPSPTESLRADMILTGENPAGVGAMSWGNPALPSPFPGEISIGSPRTPKGIGRTTGAGFGYGGSPMSGQMLEMVVTKGPIKTPTSYKSAMDVVIGQKATAARMKPVTEAAVRENILPSATEKTFTKPVKFDGFEEVLTGVLEGNKRTPAETSAGKSFRYKGVQIDYLRDAMRQRKGTFTFEQEQPKSASKSSKKNVATWFSKQQQRSVSRVSAQPAVKLPAQTPINIPQQSVSQSPMQAQVQPSMQSQIPIQTVVRTQVQLQPQINPQISRNPQIPVQQNGPGNRQQQNPFSGTIQQPAPIVTPIQSPRTATQQVTRQVVDTPFAPFPISPTIPVSEKPFAPTTPAPYIPTPRIPGPIVPTGGGGGGGGSHWIRGGEPDIPPPPIPPIGLPWGGAGGESPFTRKRRSAFIETFNMGLDMGFLGRKGRAAKSFTTPAKYKRKPAAAKPSSKKSTSRKRK